VERDGGIHIETKDESMLCVCGEDNPQLTVRLREIWLSIPRGHPGDQRAIIAARLVTQRRLVCGSEKGRTGEQATQNLSRTCLLAPQYDKKSKVQMH
jgi:hypothetical protein